MLSDRRSRDYLQPPRSPTPKVNNRAQPPLPASRNLTPSRVEERVATSPLRQPLQNAIYHTVRDRSTDRHSQSRSRVSAKSSRREPWGQRRGLAEDEEAPELSRRVHAETVGFLKRFFDLDSPIPVDNFIDCVLQQYEGLWQGQQQAEYMTNRFSGKVVEIFGEQVEPRRLLAMTRQDGILGLIEQIFRAIYKEPQQSREGSTAGVSRTSGLCSGWQCLSRSPQVQSISNSFEEQMRQCTTIQNIQNVKDCVQQFMQLMYNTMQKQIYKKFNLQMRRMVIKHKDAQKLLKKIQQKLTHHADYFDSQQKWKNQFKQIQQRQNQLTKQVAQLQEEIKKQKIISNQARVSKEKIEEENNRLKESVEKYQNILLSKFEGSQGGSISDCSLPSIPTLPASRRMSGTPLQDRTQEIHNLSPFQGDAKPFQLKIDTHFIQRENAPPITTTTTTFHEPSSLPTVPVPNFSSNSTYSPMKRTSEVFEGSRPSMEGGGIRPGTKIGEHIYSPYQSRLFRPT